MWSSRPGGGVQGAFRKEKSRMGQPWNAQSAKEQGRGTPLGRRAAQLSPPESQGGGQWGARAGSPLQAATLSPEWAVLVAELWAWGRSRLRGAGVASARDTFHRTWCGSVRLTACTGPARAPRALLAPVLHTHCS